MTDRLTTQQVADALGVTSARVRQMVKNGELTEERERRLVPAKRMQRMGTFAAADVELLKAERAK